MTNDTFAVSLWSFRTCRTTILILLAFKDASESWILLWCCCFICLASLAFPSYTFSTLPLLCIFSALVIIILLYDMRMPFSWCVFHVLMPLALWQASLLLDWVSLLLCFIENILYVLALSLSCGTLFLWSRTHVYSLQIEYLWENST